MTHANAAAAELDTDRATRRRRMALALVAGGLVLGVGTAITLAVWNDSEFVTGTFGAGTFDLEGSTDGVVFSSDPAAPGKTLTFELNADALAPDDVVYAPFALQLSDGTTNEAAVTLANTITGSIGEALTYSLYLETDFGVTCSAATPPSGDLLVSDRAADAAGTLGVLDLIAAGEPANFCFVVTAGALEQGETGSITWEFAGTSGARIS